MTENDFRSLAETWGGDLDRWPRDRQADARTLLARSPAARQMLAEAAALDAFIAAAPPVPVSPVMRDAVLALPRGARQERRASGGWRFDFSMVLPRFAGLAAAAVLGFYIGTTSLFAPGQTLSAQAETVNISDYVFGDTLDGESGL